MKGHGNAVWKLMETLLSSGPNPTGSLKSHWRSNALQEALFPPASPAETGNDP